jgi:hypothetical protein
MAARVRVTCSTCGDVAVSASRITATVVAGRGGGCFAFACPVCFVRQARAASASILEVLSATGVEPRTIPDPATLERRPATTPVTGADVEDAVRLLADDVRFSQAIDALATKHAFDQ